MLDNMKYIYMRRSKNNIKMHLNETELEVVVLICLAPYGARRPVLNTIKGDKFLD
jgi:hypothetical protein